MGLLDLKPTVSAAKAASSSAVPSTQLEHNVVVHHIGVDTNDVGRAVPAGTLVVDNSGRGDGTLQVKAEVTHLPCKSASTSLKDQHISLAQAVANAQAEASKSSLPPVKHVEDNLLVRATSGGGAKVDENISKASHKLENEVRRATSGYFRAYDVIILNVNLFCRIGQGAVLKTLVHQKLHVLSR